MRIRTRHDLAALIRGSREDLGLSQESLAVRSGVSRKTVNELETGRSDPLLSNALAVLDALGIPLSARRPSVDPDSENPPAESHPDRPPASALDHILNPKGVPNDS